MITLLLVGWIIAFAGFLMMDRQQHGHWPPAAEVLELAAISTFMGPMLGLAGAWQLGLISPGPRGTRRMIVFLALVVVGGVLIAALL